MTLQPNAHFFLDGVVKVRVVKDLGDGRVIIAVGNDTQVVQAANLSTTE